MQILVEPTINFRCKRCHRKLKDADAKRLGYGKICYEKIKPKQTNYLFDIKKENTL